MKPLRSALAQVATWLGQTISEETAQQLERYAAWLAEEAVAMGGIGPAEHHRIWRRHVLDSLLFAKDLSPVASVLDVGTGVGLPGIPVALMHPGPVTLLDRSGRRVDALYRVLSILGCDVSVVHEDVERYTESHDRVLFRASLSLEDVRRTGARLCGPDGEIWFGLARGEDPEALRRWRACPATGHLDERLIEARLEVLDSPVWLLRMVPI